MKTGTKINMIVFFAPFCGFNAIFLHLLRDAPTTFGSQIFCSVMISTFVGLVMLTLFTTGKRLAEEGR